MNASIRIARRHSVIAVLIAATFICSAGFAAGATIEGTVSSHPHRFLRDTVVYLKKAPAHHGARTAIIDQKGMKFLPHVLVVQVGDTVKFTNHDHVKHNVMSPDNGGYNLGMIGFGKSVSRVFKKAGQYAQLCNIHPEMLGFVYVAKNRFAVPVDAKGHFHIDNIPAGTWQLAVWNAHLHAPDQAVKVAATGKTAVTFALKR